MVIRVVAIVTVFLAFVNCNPTSLEKSEECDYCIDFIQKGLSPYEVLWTLKEKIGSELPSELLEIKMLIRTEDIKMAEGVFLEYCRRKCQNFFKKEKDKADKNLAKNGNILHFISAEEEEKFTKLAKTEFEKFKKKPDKVKNYERKTSLEAPKINLNNTNEKHVKLYQNVVFGTEVLNRHRKSRSLQNSENSGNGSTSVPEVTPRQLPVANETSEASEPKETVEVNTTESTESLTESSKNVPQTTPIVQVTEASTTAKPGTTTPSHGVLGNDDSNYDDLFSILDFLGKDREMQKDKPEGYGKILDDLINPAYSEEAIKSISKTILQTTDFVNCILDLILNEMGAALGIQPGVLIREQCDKNLPPSMTGQDIASIFTPLMKYIQSQKITTNPIPPVQNFEGPKYGFPNHFAGASSEYRPPGFPSPGVETFYGGYQDGSYPYYPFGTSRSLSTAPFYSSGHGTAASGSVGKLKNFIPQNKFNSWYPHSILKKEN